MNYYKVYFPEIEIDVECKKSARNLSENFNESSKMCESVSPQIATSVECKTKTDVKQNFDKVALGVISRLLLTQIAQR